MLYSAKLSLFYPNALESGIKFESAPSMMLDLQAQLLRYTHVTISLYLDKHMHNIRKYFLEQGDMVSRLSYEDEEPLAPESLDKWLLNVYTWNKSQ